MTKLIVTQLPKKRVGKGEEVSSEYFFQTPNMAKYELVVLCQSWSSKRG